MEERNEGRRDVLWAALVIVSMLFVASTPQLWWDNIRVGLEGLAGLLP